MSFTGIPAAAFDFYDALVANNDKAWWTAHKETYDTAVRAPLEALLAELEPEFGRAHVYRPYRDVRFAKDKTPYKDHQGAFVGLEDAIGYYVQVSRDGLMVAGGWYHPQGQQLARYRATVDSPAGAELERISTGLRRKPYERSGNELKKRPQGFADDHPRLELLRMRQFTLHRSYDPEAWMGTREVVKRVRGDWRAMRPLIEWLADHVGPAEDPREPQ